MSGKAYILDNGAHMAKAGLTGHNPQIIPNCIMKAKSERRRPFIGKQVDECRDASGLYYILPFQKGFLLNWDTQKTTWDYIFSRECCPASFTKNPLIVTEPLFNFPSIQEAMTEIFFEEYDCQSLLRINATDLCNYKYCTEKKTLCCLVVDTGFSFTHIVPYIKNKKRKKSIRRLDIGGKLLTNHLKDVISYRQLNVMDETYVINQVKEDSCFISQDFYADMAIAKKRGIGNTIIKEYVLPDYTTVRRGFIRDPHDNKERDPDQQVLIMNNERFSIPEILFHPSDVGIRQMGIPEAIMEVVNHCPADTKSHLLANILVVGGCAKFSGFRDRLYKEVRAMAPDHIKINVTIPDDPITYAWHGGSLLSKDPDFYSLCMTREEYEEEGKGLAFERFDV